MLQPDSFISRILNRRKNGVPLNDVTAPGKPVAHPSGRYNPDLTAAVPAVRPGADMFGAVKGAEQEPMPPVNQNSPSPVNPTVSAVKPPLSATENLQSQINAITSKDYSLKRDEQGNIIGRGKDRDSDFDFKDVLGGLGIGFLRGGIPGAIQGAMDRNTVEKFRDNQQLANLYPRLAQQKAIEKDDADTASKQAQTDYTRQRAPIELAKETGKDERFKAELQRKANRDKALETYQQGILALREAGVKQGDARLELLQKRLDETIRSNNVREDDRDLDREARTEVAKILAGSRERIAADDRNSREKLAAENRTAQDERTRQVLRNKSESDVRRDAREAGLYQGLKGQELMDFIEAKVNQWQHSQQ